MFCSSVDETVSIVSRPVEPHDSSHAAARGNLTTLSTGKFSGLNFLPLPVKLFGFSVRSQDICKFVLLLSIFVIRCGDVRNESWSFGELCQATRGTTCNPKDPDLKQWHGSSEGGEMALMMVPWGEESPEISFSLWHLWNLKNTHQPRLQTPIFFL